MDTQTGANSALANTVTQLRAKTLAQLARELQVSVGLLRLEIARGKLRATRLGRRIVIMPRELERYIEGQTAKGK